ncbi:MAG: flavodoxin domain-containing protein [Lachnospiraceae bacterium]|nr:flavodoxin domain-containing protein [Lachnospiraceae bacterium]
MRPTIVIYKSKYGTTQAYAKKIAKKLDTEAILVEQLKEFHKIGEYENVVLCLPVYNSGLAGMNTIKARYYMISEKNITLLMVGMSDPADEGSIYHVINNSLTDNMKRKFEIYYANGKMRYNGLMFADKLSWNNWMKRLAKVPVDELNDKQKEMLEHAKDRVDFYDESMVESLIAHVRNI